MDIKTNNRDNTKATLVKVTYTQYKKNLFRRLTVHVLNFKFKLLQIAY